MINIPSQHFLSIRTSIVLVSSDGWLVADYIDVEADSTTFTFHTDGSHSYDRSWEIYVQQLTCDAMGTAGRPAHSTCSTGRD